MTAKWSRDAMRDIVRAYNHVESLRDKALSPLPDDNATCMQAWTGKHVPSVKLVSRFTGENRGKTTEEEDEIIKQGEEIIPELAKFQDAREALPNDVLKDRGMDQASIDLLHRALDVFVLGFQNFAEEIVGNADDPGETLVEAWLYFLHAAEHLICKHHRSPLASALGRTKERIQNLEEHVESYAKEAADARETSRNASERAHRAEIQLEEANQMRKNAEKRAEEIEEKRDEIADRLARASEETNEVARERDAMRESLRAKEEEQETVDSLRSKVEKLQRELTEAHARGMEAVRSSKDDAERRASQLQEEVLRLKSDLNERIKSLASVSKRRDELRTEVEEERDARRNAEADKEAWEALARRLQENAHDRETADREARARHTSIVGAARADTSTPSESVRKGGSSTNSDQAVSEEAHHAHSNHQGSDVVQKEQQRVPGDVMNQGDQVGKAIEEKKRLEERLRVCLQRAHDTLQRFAGISSGTESAPSDPESAISALTSLLHHQRLAPTEGGEEDSARELTSHRQARPFSPAKTSESKQQGKARASTSSLSASVTPTGRDIGIQVGGNQPTVGLSSRGGKSHLSERDSEMEEQLNSASLPRVVSRESQGEEAPANHQEMNQGNDTPLRRGRKSARAQRSSEKMEHQSPMQRSENTPVFGRGDEAESAVGKESEGKELTEEESIMKEPWLGRLGEAGEAQERGKDDHQGEIHGTGAFYQTSRGDRHAERLKEGNDSDEEAGSSEVSEESRDSLDPKLSTPYEAPSADNVTGYSQEWSAPRSVSALGCIETDEHFRAQMTEGQQSTTAAPIEQSELEGSADHSYAQPSKSSMVLHSRDDVLKSQQTDHAEKAATRDHNHGKGKWKLDTRSSSECWVPPMRSYDAATPHEQAARPKERPRSSSGVRGEARGVGHSIRVAARVSGDASTSRGFGPPTERRAPPTERRGTLKGGGNVHAIPVYLQLSESTRKKSGPECVAVVDFGSPESWSGREVDEHKVGTHRHQRRTERGALKGGSEEGTARRKNRGGESDQSRSGPSYSHALRARSVEPPLESERDNRLSPSFVAELQTDRGNCIHAQAWLSLRTRRSQRAPTIPSQGRVRFG